ncbi:metallothionein expression activator [Aspergillus udagawae]|nr:metallothionein expression activator [Aspergillus udagawae]
MDRLGREGSNLQHPVSSVAVEAIQLLSPESLRSPPAPKSAFFPQPIKLLLESPVAQVGPNSIKFEVSPKGSAEQKFLVVLPLKIFAISPADVPVPALTPEINILPPLAIPKLPDNRQSHTTLPSLRTALAGISGPYTPPPVPKHPPSISRNEPAWDYKRSGQFVPSQAPASTYSYLSPVRSKNTTAQCHSTSQKYPQRKDTRPNFTCPTTSNYKPPSSTAKGLATSYTSPTNETSPGEQPPFNSVLQPIAQLSTGTFNCRHPGCTVAPFPTRYRRE